MSLVTITPTNGESRTGDVVASRTWRLPVTGNYGDASFTVPYGSPMEDVIDLEAGFTVLIHSADGLGSWSGVGVDADWNDAGITVTAEQVWMMLGKRSTDMSGSREAILPGFLVTEIIRDCGLVLGMTMPNGPFDGDSPIIGHHEWAGEDCWGLSNEMMGRSDNELWVDPETLEVSWIGPLAEATVYAEMLIAGQSLTNWSYRESNRERVSEVVGIYQGDPDGFGSTGIERHVASHGESAVAGWPGSATITTESLYALKDATWVELNRRSAPSVVLTGDVPRRHSALRERDHVTVCVPHRGRTHTCRVLARTVDDAALTIGVELMILPNSTTATSIKPPGTTSRDITRGTGNLPQRIARLGRRSR